MRCALCGKCGHLERHHLIFGRGMRALSEKYGLVVPLCRGCHARVHKDKAFMDWSRKKGQEIFEKGHTREEFIEIFGKTYLEEKNG